MNSSREDIRVVIILFQPNDVIPFLWDEKQLSVEEVNTYISDILNQESEYQDEYEAALQSVEYESALDSIILDSDSDTPGTYDEQLRFMRRVGEWLYRSLEPNVKEAILKAGDYKLLRIVIHETAESSQPDMPWEYLYSPYQENFIALIPNISIVRYYGPPIGVLKSREESVASEFSVLPIAVSPEQHGDMEVEHEHMPEDIRQCINIPLPIYAYSEPILRPNHDTNNKAFDINELRALIESSEPSILHLAAHGYRNQIVFPDSNGESYVMNAPFLSNTLSYSTKINLLSLCVCSGAGTSSRSGIKDGCAASLSVSSNIPWIIACRHKIRSEEARIFFRTLYFNLVTCSNIEKSIGFGRNKLRHRNMWLFGSIVCYIKYPGQDVMKFLTGYHYESNDESVAHYTERPPLLLRTISDILTDIPVKTSDLLSGAIIVAMFTIAITTTGTQFFLTLLRH